MSTNIVPSAASATGMRGKTTDQGSNASTSVHDDSSLNNVPEPYTEGQNAERTISRIISRKISGQVETYEDGTPLMGPNKDYPPKIENRERFKVEFLGSEDPALALNWSNNRKLRVLVVTAYATLVLSWGSAVYAPGIPEIMERFHVGSVVASLGVSLYVAGFAAGPVLWGPLSELYGRKMPLLISYFAFLCFTFASATAQDYQTLMLSRFFAGALGSAPLSVAAAVLADMFNTRVRGVAMSVFSMAVMGGPMISPVIGAYIAASHLGWRWTEYITGIMAALAFVLLIFFQDESYAPIILKWRAETIREKTGNWAVYAEIETQTLDFREIAQKSLSRPLVMLFTEPILFLISLYSGFVYGILYMSLSSMPIIFSGYGWKGGNLMLPYLAIFIGCFISNLVNIFVFEPKFHRDLAASGKPVAPEARLPLMMMGSVFFSIGIFWLCWTGAYPKHVHWIVPTIGAGFYGFGFIALFLPVFNYVIDSYLMYAASALSGNAFLRGAMGAAFPLFAAIMFRNLGIQWAGTLVGCLSLLMLPMPFLFYKYGAWLRSKSKYAFNLDDQAEAPGVDDKGEDAA